MAEGPVMSEPFS